MALTANQIQQLLNKARAEGFSEAEVQALEWSLYDRAANPDGAARLDAALTLAAQAETDAAEAFITDAAAIRTRTMQRGADELNALSDDEWNDILGSQDNANQK